MGASFFVYGRIPDMEFGIFPHLTGKSAMMKTILLLFLLTIAVSVQSQTVLKVIAIDKMTKDPVQHATVFVSEGNALARSVYSNKEGTACFTISGKDSVEITCNHTAYGSEKRVLFPRELNRDTVKVTVYMRFEKTTSLEGITIRPKGVPVAIYKSERLSVDDFEFLPDGRMLLLTYAKNKKKGTELFLYDAIEMQVQSGIPL